MSRTFHAYAPRGVFVALVLTPLLAGCFVSGGQCTGTGAEGGSEGRLRVALARPPVMALSPYSDDATLLGKLSVVEGLTALDKNGAAAPALAKSWNRRCPRRLGPARPASARDA
ncbi:hypothetical protein GCM10017771_46620 [Streptomyces capitiformicae]|uniref:Uncharacterized protein n=1 Tax=Streptomyces capitiformicae TaxID=2014920 RepID=A0A918YZM1_9ACTN|nr:hypothetical protein GCM10017771_46620 [Streptomyces capitiformicae]